MQNKKKKKTIPHNRREPREKLSLIHPSIYFRETPDSRFRSRGKRKEKKRKKKKKEEGKEKEINPDDRLGQKAAPEFLNERTFFRVAFALSMETSAERTINPFARLRGNQWVSPKAEGTHLA